MEFHWKLGDTFQLRTQIAIGRHVSDDAEITFGSVRQERMAEPLTWVNVSEEGYWLSSLSERPTTHPKPNQNHWTGILENRAFDSG